MGKGKVGAQCAHAAVGIVMKYRARNEIHFRQWDMCGQPKVALKVRNVLLSPWVLEWNSSPWMLTVTYSSQLA